MAEEGTSEMQQSREFESSGQPAGQDSTLFPGIVAPVAAGSEVSAAHPTPAATDGDVSESEKSTPAEVEVAKPVPKRRRGRPRKVKSEGEQVSLDVNAMTKVTQEATQASAVIHEPPVATLAEADANVAEAAPKRHRKKRASSPTFEQDDGAQASEAGVDAQDVSRQASLEEGQPQSQDERGEGGRQRRGRRERKDDTAASGGPGNNANGSANTNANTNGNASGNQRGSRRNRRNRRNQQEQSFEPSLSREELASMRVAELRSKAAQLGVEYVGLKKAALVETIYEAAARAEGFRPVEGVLDVQNEGYAFLRTGNYMTGDDDAFVHQQLIRQYGLRPGDRIKGSVGPARSNNSKYPPLQKVETVNGRPLDELRQRPRFRDLTPIFPNQRLVMECGKDSITGRAIDLVAPIGKGQRGLIVSPPKAGKTTVLKRICQSIASNNPEVHLLCLLVDERPEEVTDMERSIKGEVVASTFDMPASNHTAVSELVIEHAKRLVELGEDVVVVLDSITRLARAYNLAQPPSGRILSGGVDSAALYPPKKFLGAARNIEGGGSLTIIASALVDTGSKMDEVIFEEFKGTGNMELKLDRDLADRRIFPAIDPVASGTRNEELLIRSEIQPFVWGIRRVLANMNNVERAASVLVKGLRATSDNEEFLIRSAKKAQQSNEYIA